VANAALGAQDRRIYHAHQGRCGSPRIVRELATAGRGPGRTRVARVMRAQGLVGRRRRRGRRTTDSRHAFPVAANVLARHFTTRAPNQVWVTDLTYIGTRQGWLYLSVILDLYSRAVVGWAMSERIDTALCLTALTMAVQQRRPPAGLLHHSDRGSQYASHEYQAALRRHGMICSMSRRGDCWDNAVAESFWSTLKTELADTLDFATRRDARRVLFEYLEGYYNRRRRHSALAYRSPHEHEQLYDQATSA
jgi:transposase InsO family protein